MADADNADPIVRALAQALTPGDLGDEREGFGETEARRAAVFVAQSAAVRESRDGIVAIAPIDRKDSRSGMRGMRAAIVNDDMPFLVDSVANCLAGRGIVIQRLLHPVLGVERDSAGQLMALVPADSPGTRRESFIYLELEQVTARQRERLEDELRTTLAHVRAAVRDWGRMQDALAVDADRAMDEEGAALLRWLLDRNLTQTGHQICRRDGSCEAALGICALETAEPLLAPSTVSAAFDWFEQGGRAPLIIKSNRSSRVHRTSLLDLFLVPIREGNRIAALSIHAGMWTSAALATPPDRVPMLRSALASLMEKHRFDPSGHAGKTLFHALTALPHDVVIGFDRPTQERLALTFMSLADRPRPKLVLAAAALHRHLYAFIWLPRDDVSTSRRSAIQDMLTRAANAPLLSWSIALEEGGLALLRITLDLREGGLVPDEAQLDAQVQHMVRGWAPGVEAALTERVGAEQAARLTDSYAESFPQPYRIGAGPDEAAADILELSALSGPDERRVRLYRNSGDKPDELRLKVYSRSEITLSDAVPAFENFGFRAIDEIATPLDKGKHGHIHRFLLARRDGGDARALLARADVLQPTLAGILAGRGEDDRFNQLVVLGGLDPTAAVLLRALFRYLRQTGMPHAMGTVVDTLGRQQTITGKLIALFHALHDPEFEGDRTAAAKGVDDDITAALMGVTAIDEDRVIRLFRAAIQAVLRTNFFLPSGAEALAFKLDSAAVPGLPRPLPWREIWVYSPRVEGIHLRAGPIARGGLRWSDRRDDFRTEVLGLMKAQRVKNAVIVPTGAKGGFYPKQLPNPAADRDAWLAEGTESYRTFICALLSVTDNIVAGEVTHPEGMVIRDGDDPYFVVAADKGTATFSDVANAIALEQGFWLGDAFASGGSNGYDHKAMGITARGAWVSVQRHFAEMGVDVQKDSISVVGVGDMSGDVFGNGMLRSRAVRLVAAFDHRHIFIDPEPDAERSYAERERLFALPRSSWDDYDRSLISAGGGVFPRSQKSIPLSPEMRATLDVADEAMEPGALISAILRAPADLLWFGGIGTYVKASAQSNAEVGDTANDAVRVDAEDVRAKVIGEGANLGVTQAGRIAYALCGGRINTDFIDNSAGVDCSDNEVNIKIALNREMAEGRLSLAERNALLVDMTDAVAELVLEDNRLQALGLSIAENDGPGALPSYIRLIETFEASGRLDRRVEGLAGNDQLLRRVQDRKGMTRPELAMLLSTAKLALQEAVEKGALTDDPAMDTDLIAAFPPQMCARAGDAIRQHRLRREIVATKLANRIVNRLSLIHPFELTEEEGCSLADMASAFVVAERLLDVGALWRDIDAAEMPESGRIRLLEQVGGAMRAHMASVLRIYPAGFHPGDAVRDLKSGVDQIDRCVDNLLTELLLARAAGMEDELETLGVPGSLAQRASQLFKLDGAIGIADLGRNASGDVVQLARAFVRLGEAVGVAWMQASLSRMQPADPWERQLLSGVSRDIQQVRLALLARLGTDRAIEAVESWIAAQEPRIVQFRRQLERAQAAPAPTVAMLAELAAHVRTLTAR